MSRPRMLALVLGLLTLVVYLPVSRFGFVNFDDDVYVTNNSMVRNGFTLDGFKRAFTETYAVNWHPVTWLSHMVDCQVFGLDPRPQHLVNALLHAANAALLLALMVRLTARVWPSVLVAALFAWHPLHVESVAWIAERKDVLSMFFGLLSLWYYTGYTQESRWAHFRERAYWLALVFFALALMSKPMMVTLPCVMLLLDWWPLNRLQLNGGNNAPATPGNPTPSLSIARALVEKWPFFALVAVSCVITLVAQSSSYQGHVAVRTLEQVPLSSRLSNTPVAYVTYLFKTFWPAKLAVFYPFEKNIPLGLVAGATLVLGVISKLVWDARRARPYFMVGWLWFLGTLVPVIGLVTVGGAAWADRYAYLPSVGIFIMVAFAAAEFVSRHPAQQKVFTAGAALVLALCVGLTERQLSFWENSGTLFRRALAVATENSAAHQNLADYLLKNGHVQEALAEYRKAAAMDPQNAARHNDLAVVHDLSGNPAEALAEYRKALELAPNDASQHTGVGYELMVLGQYEAALQEFLIAEKLAPRYAKARIQAAQVLFKMGRGTEGVAELRGAVQVAPDDWQTLTETARFLATNDDPAGRDGIGAMKLAAKANLLTKGGVATVCDVLGMACAEAGDFDDAVDSVQHAIDLAAAAGVTNPAPLLQRLEFYKQKKPWRESYRLADIANSAATNAVPAPK